MFRKAMSLTLPIILGDHQHGFMAGKNILEPSLLATHLIKDAQQTHPPLQLISLDIEKPFVKSVMLSSLKCFEPLEYWNYLSKLCKITLLSGMPKLKSRSERRSSHNQDRGRTGIHRVHHPSKGILGVLSVPT
jgi:hypothetical protein